MVTPQWFTKKSAMLFDVRSKERHEALAAVGPLTNHAAANKPRAAYFILRAEDATRLAGPPFPVFVSFCMIPLHIAIFARVFRLPARNVAGRA
jgi:hypothetical protein